MNPTALLKIIGALAPLMGDKEIGISMMTEIRGLFEAIQRMDNAVLRIERMINDINAKLQGMALPLSENEIALISSNDYVDQVNQAIALGEQPHAVE